MRQHIGGILIQRYTADRSSEAHMRSRIAIMIVTALSRA